MTESKRYSGGCHCGKVRYEVSLKLDKLMSCNCSICGKTGGLMAFTSADDFELKAGAHVLTDYQFGKETVHHLFCPTCGIRSFGRGQGPGGKEMVMINARCLDEVTLDDIAVTHFDGKSL